MVTDPIHDADCLVAAGLQSGDPDRGAGAGPARSAVCLLALHEAGTVTAGILRHLGLATEVPAARPARAPPLIGADESW